MRTTDKTELDALYETYHPWWGGSSKRIVINSHTEVMSVSHPAPFGRSSGGDNGGPFQLYKDLNKVDPAMLNYDWGSGYDRGPLLPGSFVDSANDPSIPQAALMLPSALEAEGATLLSRALPTNPSFSLMTAAGEIMNDGLPSVIGASVWKDKAKFLKGSGSEYLNTQFGWMPMISDMRKFAHNVKNSHKIINSYRKDANRDLRRRREGPKVTKTDLTSGSIFPYPIEWNSFGQGRCSATFSSKLWFSGSFRYYLPVGDTTMDKVRRFEAYANQLLGTRLTPSVVWNLAPWSWAADWFTNIGGVMDNISALGSDGLVMRYGYVMYQSESEIHRTGTFQFQKTYDRPVDCSWIMSKKTCQRIAANPYGFGIDFDSLSAKQVAILVALGLSRGSK